MDVTIRPGRVEDQIALAAFTEDTFEWGDYVSRSFLGWLEDDAGQVLVAVDRGDRPVGVIRVVMLSPTEAWLHAIRVAPPAQRQGIGSRMTAAAEEWARAGGARVARLLTEGWNQHSQRLAAQLGYRDVSRWTYAERDVGPNTPDPRGNGGRRVPGEERLRPAPRAEVEPAYMAWAPSDLAQVGRGLFPIWWTFRRLDAGDLAAAAARGHLWECRAGWVVREVQESRLHISWLATTPEDADALARAMLDRAIEDNAEQLSVLVPQVEWMTIALERIGCELHTEILWEKAL